MNRKNIEPYFLTDEKEKELWQEATFVFDTSSLLQVYYYSKKAQKELFDKTFEKIAGRLWLPNHVEFEFLKNRKKTLRKPINEKYEKLKQGQLKGIKDSVENAKQQFEDFKNHTSKDEIHPHLDIKNTQCFQKEFESFEEQLKIFQNKTNEEIDKRIEEIENFSNNDTVLESFEKYFQVGEKYSFSKLLKIVTEGELRYKFEIPPGFQDFKGKDKKEGMQIFGDFIIWKQIIDYAKENKTPIIFIINDVKNDWCYESKRGSEKRIDRPREELIKEISDASGVSFWMYTLAQFLHKANDLVEADISADVIAEINSFEENIPKIEVEGDFYLECKKCAQQYYLPNNEMNVDFEIVDADERGMGPEYTYEWNEYCYCTNPKCTAEHIITCRAWEYPVGVKNYDEFEAEGAIILEEPEIIINSG